ncbi:MAG: hypothetical protein P1P82_01415 [Bacteroidales bacterium]|nr:hypothetical protein [Bacteroidales bacterium]MDT8431032.1 hypothetical protein [Bacteroidales bacterium]
MKKYYMISFLSLVILCSSCEWLFQPNACDDIGPIIIYKTKDDYQNFISVQLSKDGSKITAIPDPETIREQVPIPLENGYLYKRMIGDVYLSITIDEYADPNFDMNPNELLKHILDKEPYLEKYQCCKCVVSPDTSVLNNLIRENRLSDCENVLE